MRALLEEYLPIMVFILIVLIGLNRLPKRIDKTKFEEIVTNKRVIKTRAVSLEKKGKIAELLDTRKKNLNILIDKTHSPLRVEDIYAKNKKILLIGVVLAVLVLVLMKSVLIGALILLGSLALCYKPDYDLKNAYKMRCEMFTEELPNFIMNINMSLNAGLEINPAMEKASHTVDELIRDEFVRLLTESKVNPDKLSDVYRNLSNRIETEEVQIFANTILTGLQNGTSMEKIFDGESKRLKKTKVTLARMKLDKAESSATLLAIALTLFPGIIMIIAPFMLNS